ncbi:MAG TPA: hypothetical protein DFK21_05340 [Salmonella bongori]|uniref:Uncharacterized protein n=1 Tax=Salmonella bongori serovar 66:z41:- str. SA19983605 TaxID=1243617 RepID=A0A248K4Y2_SALBN|nr:hypothetical protein LFZ56_00200 [Salmonella bongori serovar 66:z41:- str. SA19983605]HBD15877.1 hypothetical protein [Salmonella bongori]HCI32948.1 hypothetical protein [Salmonella bongori]HCI36136.1 hypothetical protein [Salmonella bongori]HCI42990.1 hypothetical protein [Salmonella bongori]
MEGFIRGLVCLSLTSFIQAQRFQQDNEKFFICEKMRQRSHFPTRVHTLSAGLISVTPSGNKRD